VMYASWVATTRTTQMLYTHTSLPSFSC
jgi:hypothetical protein